MELGVAILGLLLIAVLLGALASIRIVPQSMIYVVEQFGRFKSKLGPGLNFIVPGLQYVAHKVSILERQLPTSKISVITRDNVQVHLKVSVFYRVTSAELAVYRIQNVDAAIETTTTALIRAACGELEFDDVQSKRDHLNAKIKHDLEEATKIWGIEITRTEILDVEVDEVVRRQMQQQLAADREKRAQILRAEGERQSVQLAADAQLYKAQKEAEGIRVRAEADAYATKLVGEALAGMGESAAVFEIRKRQVDAIQRLGESSNTKLLVLPTEITTALGSVQVLGDLLGISRPTGEPAAVPPPLPRDNPGS